MNENKEQEIIEVPRIENGKIVDIQYIPYDVLEKMMVYIPDSKLAEKELNENQKVYKGCKETQKEG